MKEPNIRYLGLEALGRFAQLEQLGEGGLEGIKKHQATVFVSLKASQQARGVLDDGGRVPRAPRLSSHTSKLTHPFTPKHAQLTNTTNDK